MGASAPRQRGDSFVVRTKAVGATLTANVGTWSPTPSLSYQWLRNGTAITGATAKTYKATTSDAGRALTVKVAARRTGCTTTSRTSAGASIPLYAVTAPKITGTARVSSTLTLSRGTWTPTPSSYRYQWYRSGVALSGRTGSTYTLTWADKGRTITARVTASRTGYVTGTATTAGRTVS